MESFHLGRLAVADEEREPVVIDWRAPVAEPFYRATGRNPMGLARRRHFAMKGRQLLDIEDELFGEGHLGIGTDIDETQRRRARPDAATPRSSPRWSRAAPVAWATSWPPSRPSRTRSSARRRPGVLVVQGGPGTGKTVVALHRAAYLLYTYRFPLEDQGVLVDRARTASSCATSSGCCRRSARPAWRRSCSPTSCPTSASVPRETAPSRPG